MSPLKKLIQQVNRRVWMMSKAMHRFKIHSASTLRISGTIIEILAIIASVACIVCVSIMAGYESSMTHRAELKYVVRLCQGTFVLNVLYHMIFEFHRTCRSNKLIKWILDTAIIISVLPWIWHRPLDPWLPWLSDILFSRWYLYPVLIAYSVLTISNGIVRAIGKRTNPSLLLSGSFIVIILIGSMLLQFPKCTYAPLDYADALFVSTSAVCITGLTPVEVFSTFTPLGQLVLLILIQVGCLGLMTFTSFFALFFSGSTSIYSQLMLKDVVYSRSMNALIPTLRYIFAFTIVVETIGALLVYLSVRDTMGFSPSDEVWFSIFHSVSSFCNAGFSVLPQGLANPVLMYDNLSIYWVTTLMIIAGAIGFPILTNFKDSLVEQIKRGWRRLRHKRVAPKIVHQYNMNTRIVLTTFFLLFIAGATAFFMLEYDNSLAGMDLAKKVTQSAFNSATPRSAGFSSVNPAGFLPSTLIIVMFLMWIGGGSQSTAGGIKVNTFAAICLNLRSIITGRSSVTAFSRTIAVGSIRRANAVVALSIISYFLFATTLVILEPALSTKELLFEALSALFTVGSSLGVTPMLSAKSEILLCVAMFLGRVGIISLLIGITPQQRDGGARFPNDIIIIS